MKILLIGGTGAMGSGLSRILAAGGHEVYVTSRRKDGEAQGIHFIKGNAMDDGFLQSVLAQKWDAIVDFMLYSVPQFTRRYEQLLACAGQYIFLSSSRVYADSDEPITEKTPTLLETSTDAAFLATSDYALTKARCEKILMSAKQKNWTIIRPYITYNNERLQLGVMEKEKWLYRYLQGRTVVFSEDMALKLTTLSHGEDVSHCISLLIGNEAALGEVYQITTAGECTWKHILDIYAHSVEKVFGKPMKIKWVSDANKLSIWYPLYQAKYDRLYNRTFDSRKVMAFSDKDKFIEPESGIEMCIEAFAKNPQFGKISWKEEGLKDRLTNEFVKKGEITNKNDWKDYLLYRFVPVNDIKRILKKLLKKV